VINSPMRAVFSSRSKVSTVRARPPDQAPGAWLSSASPPKTWFSPPARRHAHRRLDPRLAPRLALHRPGSLPKWRSCLPIAPRPSPSHPAALDQGKVVVCDRFTDSTEPTRRRPPARLRAVSSCTACSATTCSRPDAAAPASLESAWNARAAATSALKHRPATMKIALNWSRTPSSGASGEIPRDRPARTARVELIEGDLPSGSLRADRNSGRILLQRKQS